MKKEKHEYEFHGVDFARGFLWSLAIYLSVISIILFIAAIIMMK